MVRYLYYLILDGDRFNTLWRYSLLTETTATPMITSSDIQSSTVETLSSNTPIATSDSVYSTHGDTTTTTIQTTSESTSAVVIDNDNISNTTIVEGIFYILYSFIGDIEFVDNDNNIIVIDGSNIESTGSISIYSTLVLTGNATLTSSECISSFNESQIIIDLTTRPQDESEVLSYNCLTIPELDVALQGSYADGCIPRYEVQQTSLILIFDTPSCQDANTTPSDDIGGIILIISIIAAVIVIGVIFLVVFSNKEMRSKIFVNRTDTTNQDMNNLTDKMKQVDEQIASTTADVDRLNHILDQ